MTAKNTLHVAFIHNSVDTGINNTQAEHNFGLRFMCEDNVLIMKTKTMIVKLDHINSKCRKLVGQKKTPMEIGGKSSGVRVHHDHFCRHFHEIAKTYGARKVVTCDGRQALDELEKKTKKFHFLACIKNRSLLVYSNSG